MVCNVTKVLLVGCSPACIYCYKIDIIARIDFHLPTIDIDTVTYIICS